MTPSWPDLAWWQWLLIAWPFASVAAAWLFCRLVTIEDGDVEGEATP